MIQVIRMVTVSVIIPVESNFFHKFSRDITMHTSSTGVELSSRIGSEEIASLPMLMSACTNHNVTLPVASGVASLT